MMILPYAAEKGCTLIKSLKRIFKEHFQLTSKHAYFILGLTYYLSLEISRMPHHLKSNMILHITPFVVLKTVMRITSVKVHDG